MINRVNCYTSSKMICYSEKWFRVKVTLAAYFYEIKGESLISDKLYDEYSNRIDLNIKTDNSKIDEWFKTHFTSHTGMWVHSLPKPELKKLERIYKAIKKGKKSCR
jgi:hypothetical protein